MNSIETPESLDPHSLAEWMELLMMVDGTGDLSSTEILSSFPAGRRPPVDDVEFALQIVEDRAVTAPCLYPFRRLGDRVVLAGHPDSGDESVDPCVYLFMLIACAQDSPWALANQAARVGSLFDHLVVDAMVEWQGAGSRGVIFGWPPRAGRPSDLSGAVSWLADLLELPDGDLDRPPDGKDGGVDCVVWKPAHDRRSGVPVWLVQASVEHEVVGKAARVIPLESWKRWIKFGAGPTTVFATPHSVPAGSNSWVELNDSAELIADRLRIMHLLHGRSISASAPDWLAQVCGFVDDQLELIRNPPDRDPAPRVRKRKRERTGVHADPKAR